MAPDVVLPTPPAPAIDIPAAAAASVSPAAALAPLIRDIFKTSTLSFYLNNTLLKLDNVDPEATLLDFIRSQRGLKGTKLGCGEGGCGACTVVVQQVAQDGRLQHLAVNACLVPVVSVEGKHVITIEALGTSANPHPLQERIAKLHGSQCGFCTPGIVMSLYALLRNSYNRETNTYRLTEDMIELEGVLDGNLCRCTGYKPILDAAKSFIQEDLGGTVEYSQSSGTEESDALRGNWTGCSDKRSAGSSGEETTSDEEKASPSSTPNSDATEATLLKPCGKEDCCRLPKATDSPKINKYAFPQFNFKTYSPNTEITVPSGLRSLAKTPLCFGNSRKIWFRPTKLEQLLKIKNAFPECKLVAGSSEVQVELRFKNAEYSVLAYVGDIQDLKEFSVNEEKGEVVVGGNTSLTVLEEQCLAWHKKLGRRGLVLEAIRKQLRYFAGRQIRNTATPAGNIATASPISDLNPILVAANATVVAQSLSAGEILLPMSSFFKSYRVTSLPPNAVITKIIIPLGSKDGREIVKTYKQAKRKDDDIAIVTAGMKVRISDSGIVEAINLAYGGMHSTTIQAKHTMDALLGKKWFEKKALEEAMSALEKDFPLSYSVPGGMPTYRKTLSFSFLFRFWHEVAHELGLSAEADQEVIAEIQRGVSFGSRDNESPYEQRVVGKQIPHLSGLKQATGEAEYVDDMPRQEGELFGGMVLSARGRARLKKVDWAPALRCEGVVGYVDHNDLPEDRSYWGNIVPDERFFAKDEVFSHGQPIGMILAETAIQARYAAAKVAVEYEDLPGIYTIDEAIAANSFYTYNNQLKRGEPLDNDEVWSKYDRVFSGVARMEGQEHFYLETNAALVIPKEGGEMEVWSSTQNVMETQELVAQVTGVPSNKVVAKVKRMGGGFGGKETRSMPLACLCALAAKKFGRPARGMLNRDEDMISTGQRNPFQARWKVGVSNEGKLLALAANFYNNGGYSLDLSGAVMGRALTHAENCYWIPNVHVRGFVCKTNILSNTAFRGFGAPQGMYIAECYMSAVADGLGMPVDKLREINLYKEGQLTHFLQPLTDWHIPQLLRELKEESDYERRRNEVDEFNKTHKWKKRGICIIPTKFGLSFATALHLNQAGALVHIYTDGSILLAHGGTEMGQGLHTKMCQVAAEELQVPLESVFTSESSTSTVANAPPTAASSGSDLNGMAVKHACDQLNERLKEYRAKYGNDMKKIANEAYMDRVNLSAYGFWKMPDIGYKWGNFLDPKPMYYYFTQGAAATEVEVDLLTGDHAVLRTDIKMDVGRSINPAIDYGQIEGAFTQGLGLFTLEEPLWSPKTGELLTRGPGTYKIPGFSSIPQDFRVTLLKSPPSQWRHLKTIQSSKGIGEPPLFLGATVLFAIRDALSDARKMNGVVESRERGGMQLDSPATAESIRLLVGDEVVERMRVAEDGKAWAVRVS